MSSDALLWALVPVAAFVGSFVAVLLLNRIGRH